MSSTESVSMLHRTGTPVLDIHLNNNSKMLSEYLGILLTHPCVIFPIPHISPKIWAKKKFKTTDLVEPAHDLYIMRALLYQLISDFTVLDCSEISFRVCLSSVSYTCHSNRKFGKDMMNDSMRMS